MPLPTPAPVPAPQPTRSIVDLVHAPPGRRSRSPRLLRDVVGEAGVLRQLPARGTGRRVAGGIGAAAGAGRGGAAFADPVVPATVRWPDEPCAGASRACRADAPVLPGVAHGAAAAGGQAR